MYATIGAEAGTNEGEGAQQLRRIYSVRMRIYANGGGHIYANTSAKVRSSYGAFTV